jgi:SAM-dependent methyltransferase
VQQGDVSKLDLPDGSFDLATAFETIYFWPGLEECFANVHRILRPGGHFCIVNESDGTDAASLRFQRIIDGMRCYTTEQIGDALQGAGFTTITCHHHESRPWIAVTARA